MKFKHAAFIHLTVIIIIAAFLRFYNITNDPPGLYMDEVSIGYNAHTILVHGVDEYGVKYPWVFKSFGDYKMPVYIYLTAASEYLFGENEFAVRFPSAFLGTLTVGLLYFLLYEVIAVSRPKKEKSLKYVPILSTFLLAISPWAIQFSRGGFEINVAMFFYLLALYFLLLYYRKKSLFNLIVSTIFFALTLYTYFVFRALTPLTMFIAIVIFIKQNKQAWKSMAVFGGLFLILCLPAIIFSFSSEGMARLAETSAFTQYNSISFLQKIYVYPLVLLRNYLSYFSLSFLFVTGDGIGRHQMPWFGVLPKWQIIFLLTGIYTMLRAKKTLLNTGLFTLLFISPIAASVALPSPHTLRSLIMVIPLTVFIGIGIIALLTSPKKLLRYLAITLLFLGVIETFIFLHFYTDHYPSVNSLDWGAGYKQMVQEAAKQKNKYKAILVDERISNAKNYFKFYDESLSPIIINDTWKKPKQFEGKKLLFIRPFGITTGGKLIENIYFPVNANKDIFVQFWEI